MLSYIYIIYIDIYTVKHLIIHKKGELDPACGTQNKIMELARTY